MGNKIIPQMEPWFGNEEKEAMARYMDEGGWLTEFKHTAEFEKRIEIEAQNLMYFDHMKKEKAFEKARETISQKFVAE